MMAETAARKKYELPPLPYDFSALEPVINAEIMELHYTKHHQAYVNNLNAALEKYWAAEDRRDVGAMIALTPAIRFNGGGHVNHSLFWENLAPIDKGGGTPPNGPLMAQIEKQWDSLDNLIQKFNTKTAAIQGSGWGWLTYCPIAKRLRIIECSNQDPASLQNVVPLLGIDVWEHAYYIQYKNLRTKYLEEIWKVVDWKCVAKRYASAVSF